MKQDSFSKGNILLYIFGLLLVVWLSVLVAPLLNGGLLKLVQDLPKAIETPLTFIWVKDTPKSILVFVSAYVLGFFVFLATKRNYRKRQEHGSAKWGNSRVVCNKYKDKEAFSNKILTQNVCMGFDSRKHRRNLNVLVVGGSGSGKTRFYAKPNLMQCNTSFVILDPKGELLRDTGELLKQKKYIVKIIDLINMERSHCYNPFVYLHNDNDVQKLVTNLFKNTTPKGSLSSEPFWDQAAMMLLLSLMFYLHYEAPEYEQNFPMVTELIRWGEVREDNDDFQSPLDILFNQLEMKNPEHIAVKYYRSYRSGSAKTLKSIQITLLSRLEKFNLTSLAGITVADEMELQTIGEKKTAIFAIIPDNDSSFNFIIGMLYTQLFQQLYYMADFKYGGRLPVHTHFVMDEFANIALPDEFDKLLSTMRSREISVSIILQNLAQLKALFEKQWESIIGNCDSFLYIGGNEQSTHKYVSEMLGKETIDLNTYGKSMGRSGSYSTNFQLSGRELLTPDEVRLLDNRYAILFIRGERPILDEKYNVLIHPNIAMTADGEEKPYSHGEAPDAVASVAIGDIPTKEFTEMQEGELTGEYELLSEEELQHFFENLQEENQDEKQS